MCNVKTGDYLIYLGKSNIDIGYTCNKKYRITNVDKFNAYFEDDNNVGVVFHLKHTYTDKDWLFVTNNEIRKQKLNNIYLKQVID